MPATPYVRLLVSLNDGGPQSGGITAAYGDVVQLLLENTSGLQGVRWSIFGYPPGWSCPAGWSTLPNGLYYYDGIEPPSFALPANTRWGKWMLGVSSNSGTLTDTSTAIDIVSPSGLHDLGAREEGQFGGSYLLWLAHHQANLRIIEAGLAGGGGGGGGGGVVQKSIAAGGTLTLTTDEAAADIVELTGGAASHVRLMFGSASAKSRVIRNISTDRTKYIIVDDGGAGILLPPGASRVMGIGTDGKPFAADGQGVGFECQLEIVGGSIGANVTNVMALPTGYLVHEAYSYAKTAPTDTGSHIIEVIGASPANDVLLTEGNPGNGVLGGIRGLLPDDIGDDLKANGAVTYAADQVLGYQSTVSDASAAGLKTVVTITGKRAKG